MSSKRLVPGNTEYFRELYIDYYSLLVRFARGILYDSEEAKDIVQEVFLDLWSNPADIDVIALNPRKFISLFKVRKVMFNY